MAVLKLTLNKDNTITVRAGRAIEHIGVEGKTHAQLFDAVKYALISKGASVDNVKIAEELSRLRFS